MLLLTYRPGAFSHLKQCKVIFLFSNQLTHIRADMFQGSQSVRHLDLRFNQISDIEEG